MFFCYKTVLRRMIRIRRPLLAIVIGSIIQNLIMEIKYSGIHDSDMVRIVFRIFGFL